MNPIIRTLLAICTASLLLFGCDKPIEPTVLPNACGTIIAPEGATPGDTYDINGIIYTVVDSAMLYE
ncbi:MAG: hypothetical protein ABFS32_19580, partial [Bacteroidota bacterium]